METITEHKESIIPPVDLSPNLIRETIAELRAEQKKAWDEAERPIQSLLRELRRMTPKECPSCLKTLGEVYFYKNNRAKDGLQTYCANCMKEKQLHPKKPKLGI